ncbi:hypothetical protein, partial [Bifidobacterium panos]
MVRFSSQSGLRRGLLRWLVAVVAAGLAALMVLAVAMPSAWAADKPSVTLNEDQKTVLSVGSDTENAMYKLGAASVSGNPSSYVVVQVDSGYFTPAADAPGSAEAQNALNGAADKYGEYVEGTSVKAGNPYTYVAFKTSSDDGTPDITAAQLQTYLQGLTFTTDGSKKQNVTVTVVGDSLNNLKATYNGKSLDAILYNGHAYTFIDEIMKWDDAFSAAKATSFYGGDGHLLTIESAGEHNLIYKSFNNNKGWIGATRFTTAAYAKTDPAVFDINNDSSASDYGTAWYWVTGPSAGTKIWNGTTPTSGAPDGIYANWAANEPNASPLSRGIEGCAQYGQDKSGAWNDLANDPNVYLSGVVSGFYVEFEDFNLSSVGSTASGSVERVDVSYDLDNVTATPAPSKALAGEAFSTTLTAATGRSLDVSSVSVSVGGKKLAKDTDYTFDEATGELVIPAGNVTGNVAISAKVLRQVAFVLGG